MNASPQLWILIDNDCNDLDLKHLVEASDADILAQPIVQGVVKRLEWRLQACIKVLRSLSREAMKDEHNG